jgi:hypothetical protein
MGHMIETVLLVLPMSIPELLTQLLNANHLMITLQLFQQHLHLLAVMIENHFDLLLIV